MSTGSKFAQRSTDLEVMDDLNCSGKVVDQTLRELEFINRTLGGNTITLSGIRELLGKKNISNPEILDLGCGGGDMLLLIKQKLFSKSSVDLHGVDANPNIIRYANDHVRDSSIRFSAINILSDEFRKIKCDVAVATLFFHHFTDIQLVEILSDLKRQCRVGLVINDLHRHPLAFHSIRLLARFFSKSSMVKFDAPLSVLRGFSKNEWITILREAGIKTYSIQWKWAFRWKIVIQTT